jgi:adenylate cyclase
VALFFSLLYLFPFFNQAEDKVYDLFLRFRPKRELIDKVVFLDVDDQAVAHVGVFPWPRSVIADALLRLREYGAAAAIFDIEYIDKSPTQVDEVYLQQELPSNYRRHFAEIGAAAADILSAVSAGYIKPEDASAYIGELTEYIAGEGDLLYQDVRRILRDNDAYLGQAAALFGNAWGTLNLQDYPLAGEQAERRGLAEKRFSYPVRAFGNVSGGNYVDILPAIPLFSEALRGAGFTNVEVDTDGIRRRLYLTRKVQDYWYMQLAFAPLLEFLGKPALELRPRRLVLKGAVPPGTSLPQDIGIPLDETGAMMLDWPEGSYNDSFTHVSLARFSYLEEYYAHIKEYLGSLLYVKNMFPPVSEGAETILAVFSDAEGAMRTALARNSGEDFEHALRLRDEGLRLTGDLIPRAGAYLEERLETGAGLPEEYDRLLQEAGYCGTLLDYLETELNHTLEAQNHLKNTLEGKICILGRVDTGTTDIGVTPLQGEYVNVGTHGVVLDTILSQSFITPLPSLWSIILTLLLVPGIIIGSGGFKTGFRLVFGISGVLILSLCSLAAFALRGVFLGPLGPVLGLIAALVLREGITLVSTEREKLFIRRAFSTYLSGDVVQEILDDPDKLHLGGTNRHMTVLFTDIQKFSTIAERLVPEELVTLLNDYLSAMSDVILEQRGTIDKYEGDAIIAFFGAPLEMEDHALRACRTALMMKQIEGELNRKYAETGLSPVPLYTRIGINTGPMVVGNMGTQRKMDYTVMGNAVNLAARLEGVNKQYGSWILASEDTLKETRGKIISRRLDRVRVVGINEPVRIHEILALAEEAPPQLPQRVELFHQALDLLEKRDWTAAEAAFEGIVNRSPGDAPAKIYLERCRRYRDSPPAAADGVLNLTEK